MAHLSVQAMPAYVRRVFRVFVVIAALTFAQIFWAIFVSDACSVRVNALVFFLLLACKVYYMLAEFMHVKYERRFFQYVIFLPLAIVVIWSIIAFCYEGNAGLDFRGKYNYDRPFVKHVPVDGARS